jgi:hypothetical protein
MKNSVGRFGRDKNAQKETRALHIHMHTRFATRKGNEKENPQRSTRSTRVVIIVVSQLREKKCATTNITLSFDEQTQHELAFASLLF